VFVVRLLVRLLHQRYTGSHVWRNVLVVEGTVFLTFLSHLGQVSLWDVFPESAKQRKRWVLSEPKSTVRLHSDQNLLRLARFSARRAMSHRSS
jgi:hypothetical protein